MFDIEVIEASIIHFSGTSPFGEKRGHCNNYGLNVFMRR